MHDDTGDASVPRSFHRPRTLASAPSASLERDIVSHLEDQDAVTLDALVDQMPQYSWTQIFQAVDILSRNGSISLRRHGFGYTLFSNHYVA
jgi:hypothetical protein